MAIPSLRMTIHAIMTNSKTTRVINTGPIASTVAEAAIVGVASDFGAVKAMASVTPTDAHRPKGKTQIDSTAAKRSALYAARLTVGRLNTLKKRETNRTLNSDEPRAIPQRQSRLQSILSNFS